MADVFSSRKRSEVMSQIRTGGFGAATWPRQLRPSHHSSELYLILRFRERRLGRPALGIRCQNLPPPRIIGDLLP